MPGVGKLLKQAQKMQKKMEAVQEELAQREIEVSSGGGAVKVKVNGQQDILAISLDPEFLKEDSEFVEETLLAAIQEAHAKSKEASEEEMGKVSAGMKFPGLF